MRPYTSSQWPERPAAASEILMGFLKEISPGSYSLVAGISEATHAFNKDLAGDLQIVPLSEYNASQRVYVLAGDDFRLA